MILRLHFGMFRNVNLVVCGQCGKDSGSDIMRGTIDTDALAKKVAYENIKNALAV